MAQRIEWTDRDKAAALAALDANGGNVSGTAKQLGMPRSTLQEWANGRVNSDVPELRQEKRAELTELIRDELYAIIANMPFKRTDADYRQLGTVFGILTDKLQLLEGKPTERTETVDTTFDDAERVKRITALLDAARTRRDGRVAAAGEAD